MEQKKTERSIEIYLEICVDVDGVEKKRNWEGKGVEERRREMRRCDERERGDFRPLVL